MSGSLISVDEGTLVTVTATFAATDGTPTDPTTVSLRFAQETGPGFPVTTWVYEGVGSITRVSTGVYSAALDTTGLPGTWAGTWVGTGACQATEGFTFGVAATQV